MMEQNNVVFNAARDGKLRRLKVTWHKTITKLILFLHPFRFGNFPFLKESNITLFRLQSPFMYNRNVVQFLLIVLDFFVFQVD